MLGLIISLLLLIAVVDAFTSPYIINQQQHGLAETRIRAVVDENEEDDAVDSPLFARGISSAELRQAAASSSHQTATATSSRFLQGDALHRLRQHVWSLRQDLQDARASRHDNVQVLERAILFAQNLDAEFVYKTSMERARNALLVGDTDVAREFRTQARHARNALPQFQLQGLWVGKYKDGLEMINVTYSGDTLIAYKVTGEEKGQISFVVDLGLEQKDSVLEPIELAEPAALQWGSHFLQRFAGKGQHSTEWVDGQLILVNQYFSFAWPSQQVFFGRPSAELTLKLLRNDRNRQENHFRAYLEKCFEEEMPKEVSPEATQPHDQQYYYTQEGCFE